MECPGLRKKMALGSCFKSLLYLSSKKSELLESLR